MTHPDFVELLDAAHVAEQQLVGDEQVLCREEGREGVIVVTVMTRGDGNTLSGHHLHCSVMFRQGTLLLARRKPRHTHTHTGQSRYSPVRVLEGCEDPGASQSCMIVPCVPCHLMHCGWGRGRGEAVAG